MIPKHKEYARYVRQMINPAHYPRGLDWAYDAFSIVPYLQISICEGAWEKGLIGHTIRFFTFLIL